MSNEYVALPEYEDLVVTVEELRQVIIRQRKAIEEKDREIADLRRVNERHLRLPRAEAS